MDSAAPKLGVRLPREIRICPCLERDLDYTPDLTVELIIAGWRAGLPMCGADGCPEPLAA